MDPRFDPLGGQIIAQRVRGCGWRLGAPGYPPVSNAWNNVSDAGVVLTVCERSSKNFLMSGGGKFEDPGDLPESALIVLRVGSR